MKLASELPDIFLIPKPEQASKPQLDSFLLGLQPSNPKYVTHKNIVNDYVGSHFVYSSGLAYTS